MILREPKITNSTKLIDWKRISTDSTLEEIFWIFSPLLKLIAKEISSGKYLSDPVMYLGGIASRGSVTKAVSMLNAWREAGSPYEDMEYWLWRTLARIGPPRPGEYHWGYMVAILQEFNGCVVRQIRKTYRKSRTPRPVIDIHEGPALETDFMLLNNIKQNSPWIWHMAIMKLLGYERQEIAKISHLTGRTIYEDLQELWHQLKQKP